MDERRKLPRTRTYLGGRVTFGQRYCALDCLVRNLSQNGAYLAFSDHALIPDEFDLMIPHKGDSRRVRIAWRLQENVGIEFLQQDGRSVEAAQQITALKAQNAALARRVSDLSEPVH